MESRSAPTGSVRPYGHAAAMPRAEEKRTRWSLAIRTMHWLTVAALALEFAISFGPMSAGTGAFEWLPTHLSVGAIVALLVVTRVVRRVFERPPQLGMPWFVRMLASSIHAAMYAVIIAVVFTGWAAYRPSPFIPPALLLGFVPIPGTPGGTFLAAHHYASLHRLLVWVLMALLVLHLLAALFHVAILRDDVMGSMLVPRRRPARRG